MSTQLVRVAQHHTDAPGDLPSGASRRSLHAILAELQVDQVDDAEALEGDTDRDIAEVRLIDSIDQITAVAAGTLVVLDRKLSDIADGYLMDVAVRHAVSRDAAGLMLTACKRSPVSMTARSMCRKSGLALVLLAPERDLNAVLNVVAREIADELRLTVERARRALDDVERLAGDNNTARDLAALGSRVLGHEIRLAARPPTDRSDLLSVPVIVSQPEGEQFVAGGLADTEANTLLEMLLWRLAAEASRTAFVAEQSERTNMLSVDEILRQLIGSTREPRDDLSPQARKHGIPVDGWHIVTRFELDMPQDEREVGRLDYEVRERLSRIALTTASTFGGSWHVARDPAALWLLHSTQNDPPHDLGVRVHQLVTSIVTAMRRAAPELRAYVGIGGVRAALTGVAGSATESKVAATHARSVRRTNHPVSFDAVGIRSTIVEWCGSPTVQESIDALFAPLDEVSTARRDEVTEILGMYLDCGGSIARTAEAIHLHRNAVRARLQRAVELLGVDIDDPDQRLFLHLACRSRRMIGTSHS